MDTIVFFIVLKRACGSRRQRVWSNSAMIKKCSKLPPLLPWTAKWLYRRPIVVFQWVWQQTGLHFVWEKLFRYWRTFVHLIKIDCVIRVHCLFLHWLLCQFYISRWRMCANVNLSIVKQLPSVVERVPKLSTRLFRILRNSCILRRWSCLMLAPLAELCLVLRRLFRLHYHCQCLICHQVCGVNQLQCTPLVCAITWRWIPLEWWG